MDLEQELNRLADGYRHQGYDVSVRPNPDQLPSFAQDFEVEIVGRRGDEGVLVAVRKNRNAVAADSNMQRYAETTAAWPGWRFDFVILEAETSAARAIPGAKEFSVEEINQSLEETRALSRNGFTRFAVVAAWATLEAAMRMRLRDFGQEANWRGNPHPMIKELYSAGALSPDEYGAIVRASQLRNRIVHGFASQPAESGDAEASTVQILCEVAHRLINESQLAKQPA